MDHKNKAVVLGTNYYIGLSVVRTLGKKGIHVITVNHDEYNNYGKSRYVKEALIAPHYKYKEKKYLEFLIDLAKNEPYKPVLYPTADPYVEFIDKYFYELKEYYLFPMNRKGFLTDIMDKEELERIARDHNIRTPEIIESDDPDIIDRVQNELGYPVILKPADSPSFVKKYREKSFIIRNEEELKEKLDITKKDGYEVFVQRIVKGGESNNYNFDCYIDRFGNMASYMTEYKIRQWPINFGASTYAAQKWIPEAYEFSKPFIDSIDFRGFIELEMKRDEENGLIYLIEANVRHVNFTELQIQCGFDTPYMVYLDSTEQSLESFRPINYDTGKVWRYLYEDISAMRAYERTGQKTRDEIAMENNRDDIVASTWALDDPWPGIKFFFSVIFKRIRRIFSR